LIFGAQPAGHARRQPDVCGPPPAKAAARTEEPPDALTFVAEPIVLLSPPHSSERLLHSACYGLPRPWDGRFGLHWQGGRLLVLVFRRSRHFFLVRRHGF